MYSVNDFRVVLVYIISNILKMYVYYGYLFYVYWILNIVLKIEL